MKSIANAPLARPEIVRDPVSSTAFGIVQKPLSTWERITIVAGKRHDFTFGGEVVARRLRGSVVEGPIVVRDAEGRAAPAGNAGAASGDVPRSNIAPPTTTAGQADVALSTVGAATAATGWPWYLVSPTASIGRSS